MNVLTHLPNTHYDVAVVGAGPAGIRAVVELTGLGLRTILIDSQPLPGGQIYRQPLVKVDGRLPSARGTYLFRQLSRADTDALFDTVVHDVLEDGALAVRRGSDLGVISPRAVIFAPGGYERVIPFPGWELPGVLTAGGMMRMIKTQGILPGERVAIAGTGPLLPATAHEVLEAGGHVAAVVETSSFRTSLQMRSLWRFPELWGETLQILGTLALRGVPYLFGHAVVEATGSEGVDGIRVAPLGANGLPELGRSRTFEVDGVALHHGLIPSVQLPALAECELEYRPSEFNWVPRTDDWGRTSQAHRYVAGDGAGIAGVNAAGVRGHLTALAAAHDLGVLDQDRFTELSKPLLVSLCRWRQYAQLLTRAFPVPTALYRCIGDDTIVCRCEDLTLRDVMEAAEKKATRVNEVKAWSRAGMGPCQGRMCGHSIARLVEDAAGLAPGMAGYFTPRPPVEPIPLKLYAEAAAARDQ